MILINLLHLIYYKLTAIACSSIISQSLPDLSPISHQSAVAVISNFFLASEAANFNQYSNISFTATVPSSVNEP